MGNRASAIRSLLAPEAVVLIGASPRPLTYGNLLAERLLRGAGRRRVYLINARGADVLGTPTLRRATDLPGPADLAVLAVPASGFERAVEDALAAGARALVAITAGLGETGAEGKAREAAVAERIREAGAVLLGPNCMGLYDAAAGLDCLPFVEPIPGPVAVIGQSGTVLIQIVRRLAARGLGTSRVVTVGNQADLTAADQVNAALDLPGLAAVCLYVEDYRDGRELWAALARATQAGLGAIVLAVGASEAGRRAAATHTGALISERAVIADMCEKAGAVLVTSMRQLTAATEAAVSGTKCDGTKIAVISEGGGLGVLAADALEEAGLTVPALPTQLQAQLSSDPILAGAALGNPLDLAGVLDMRSIAGLARTLMDSDAVDGVVLSSTDETTTSGDAAASLAAVAAERRRPLVIAADIQDPVGVAALRQAGALVFGDVEDAAMALRALSQRMGTLPPALPGTAAGTTVVTDYSELRKNLDAAGIQFPAGTRTPPDPGLAAQAAASIGYPVAIKALGRSHKSELGGVVLGIPDEPALRAAVTDLAGRIAPPALSVEAMVTSPGVELIVGARNDPRFGPVGLAGMGGIHTETLRDVATALGPFTRAQAIALIRSLRGAAILDGIRGQAKLALEKAADVLVTLVDYIAMRPGLAEVEINPLLVTEAAAIALDARAALAQPSAGK